jgi:DNA invertase Pin-like site-specific DNA recombinase
MLIGYIRISTNDKLQLLDQQRNALVVEGIYESNIYHDTALLQNAVKPGLQACLKALKPGDTLVVWKLDRLGRNLKHLITIINDLRQRNIDLKVLTGHGAPIDTTTQNGWLTFELFETLAEFERDLMAERTHAGLKAARARGRMGGRPCKMDAETLRMVAEAMANPNAIVHEVAKKFNITTTTLYTYLNGDGSLKEAGEKQMNKQDPKIGPEKST